MNSLFLRRSDWLIVRHAVSGSVMACLLTSPMSAHADEITYGYDALGRLTTVSVAGATAYYDYDSAGNITAIRRQATVSSTPPVGTVASSHPLSTEAPVSALAPTPTSSR
ncbi:MAG TPA: RHS repeat domain-containing protein [Paraburkholderia sp.]